jgi:hypothetical protein
MSIPADGGLSDFVGDSCAYSWSRSTRMRKKNGWLAVAIVCRGNKQLRTSGQLSPNLFVIARVFFFEVRNSVLTLREPGLSR